MKRNIRSFLVAIILIVSMGVASLPTYAYVKTAEAGTATTYNLGTLLDTKFTTKDISRMNDSAVYSKDGNEYVYVMDKSTGVYCF